MDQELNFEDLSLIEIPFTLHNKKYLLREANGDVAARFRSAATRGIRFVDGQAAGVNNLGDLEPLLVAGCVYEVVTNNGTTISKQVDESVIRCWPARVVSRLFEKAKQISCLDEKETEEELIKKIGLLQKKLELLQKPKKETQEETQNPN